MAAVIVIGGGLAGLAAAAALGNAGSSVDSRARGIPGRPRHFLPNPGEKAETIDNCQHVLLRCCVNLLDFYRRLGVADESSFTRVHLHRAGRPVRRSSRSSAGAGAFHRNLSETEVPEPVREDRGGARAAGDSHASMAGAQDLDRITMLDWLQEKRQPPRAIERFWRQVLVSAINEELDRMAAATGFKCSGWDFWRARIPMKWACRRCHWAICTARMRGRSIGNVRLHLRAPVERVIERVGAIAE